MTPRIRGARPGIDATGTGLGGEAIMITRAGAATMKIRAGMLPGRAAETAIRRAAPREGAAKTGMKRGARGSGRLRRRATSSPKM